MQMFSLSLKTKVSWLVMLLSVSCIWSLTYMISLRLEKQITAQIESGQQSTASFIAETIESGVKYRLEALTLVAATISPQLLADPAKLKDKLSEKVLLTMLFQTGVVVIGNDGAGIVDYPQLKGRSQAAYRDLEYFQEVAATGKPAVGKPRIDRFSQRPVVAFAVPIVDAAGQRLAILAGFSALSDPSLVGIIEHSKRDDYADWLILTSPKYKVYVSASDPARILQPTPEVGANPLFDRFMAGQQGSGITVNSRGVTVLESAKQIPTPGWFIRVGLPADIAFAPVQEMRFIAYAIAAGMSLLISLLVWGVIHRSFRPLYAATDLINKMAKPDAPLATVPVSRNDEVGQLLNSFNAHVLARQNAEMRMQHMSKLYQALSEVNQAIVRMKDERELFPLVCHSAVNFGGMTMAWVGQLQVENQCIVPVAQNGLGASYLQSIAVSASAEVPEGCGPTGTALRENRPVIVNDYLAAQMTKPWQQNVNDYGWRAAAAFPIPRGGKPFAVLNVYHPLTDVFDQELVNLMMEMTSDISFALDNFDRETQRQSLSEHLDYTQRRMAHIINLSPALIYALTPQSFPETGFTLSFVSASAEKITGYSTDAWIAPQFWINHVHPDDRKRVEAERNTLQVKGSLHHEYRFLHADGSYRWINDQLLLTRDDNGGISEIIGVWMDITESRAAEEQRRLAAQVFESSREGIIITDKDNKILSVNQAFSKITGYSLAEAQRKNPHIISSGRQNQAFYRAMWRAIEHDGYWQGEIWNRRKNGELYPEWLSISTVRDGEGRVLYYIGVITDMTEHLAAVEQINYLAHYDSLTRLPNRVLLHDRVQMALAAAQRDAQPMALMYLDLDRFKGVNDSLGHQRGDELLKQLASRLRGLLGAEDTLSRLGGDEFAIALLDTDSHGAAHMAQRIFDAIAKPIVVETYEFNLTVSLGIALFPDNGQDFDTLLRSADTAMYRAKSLGRNNYQFFTDEMHAQAQEILQVERDLRRAIIRDEMCLYYQPQVEIATGRIIGAEALIRWQHPQWGLTAPGRFIKVAEETGLIVELGDWVLHEALRQNKFWLDQGLPVTPIAVNVSAEQFREKSFVTKVQKALADSGLPPHLLELELTESMAMEDSAYAVEVVAKLRQLGLELSIDDFGTGYSSLSYLKRFPLQKLKIDQSFIRDLGEDADDEAIVIAIINMGKSLNFQVIAEGVETAEQFAFLRDRQCDQIQGYLFSRPLPADQFVTLLEQGVIYPETIVGL